MKTKYNSWKEWGLLGLVIVAIVYAFIAGFGHSSLDNLSVLARIGIGALVSLTGGGLGSTAASIQYHCQPESREEKEEKLKIVVVNNDNSFLEKYREEVITSESAIVKETSTREMSRSLSGNPRMREHAAICQQLMQSFREQKIDSSYCLEKAATLQAEFEQNFPAEVGNYLRVLKLHGYTFAKIPLDFFKKKSNKLNFSLADVTNPAVSGISPLSQVEKEQSPAVGADSKIAPSNQNVISSAEQRRVTAHY